MSYYTYIRIFTSKEGKKEIQKELLALDERFLMQFADIDISSKDSKIVLLGWNALGKESRRIIENIVLGLKDKDISFNYAAIGELTEDIKQYENTSSKDKKYRIEMPKCSIIRVFNDEYMKYKLESTKKKNESDKEMEKDE